MRIRKANAILGSGFLFGGLLFIYLLLVEEEEPRESGGLYDDPQAQKDELASLEAKLKNLENDLAHNANIITDLKGVVKEILEEKKQDFRSGGEVHVDKTLATVHRDDGLFAQAPPTQCDVELDKVYERLEFTNPDGGVWKQGWDITYPKNKWAKEKLKVFVVPHSHNDPGWIKTFEKYYQDQTNKILSSMVAKLVQYPNLKFIWAEISYLSMWWAEQDQQVRSAVLKLLEQGRLEIVSGGWVMPDEANSHYTAMLEQLMHGHEWCNQNLNGYKPTSGWSIDPFGMSPTMSYILKRSGLDNMLIQRTHYNIKKDLAQNQNLEFSWRQHWDHGSTTDMFCHMMPFYSYDIPHTCGPDPKICCQFDFLRLPGGRATCPWGVAPKRISAENVASRAQTLLDQYRKKATLYRSNVVFIPLGDDFRWDGENEWDNQYNNYQQMMDYINSHPQLDAEINWGTLTDYFDAVRERSSEKTGDETKLFPTLSGDFFTYADRDDHYWSGYFTSRPLWKSLDRILQHYLRGAEIMFSLAWAEMEYIGSDKKEMAKDAMSKLLYGRQMHGLFQHHDGITGTAKDHVVLDYGEKMRASIQGLQGVIDQSANFLLTSSKPQYTPNLGESYFDLDDARADSWSIPKQTVINIEERAKRVVFFNSQANRRTELVTLRVSNYNIKVTFTSKSEDEELEEEVACQISPVFNKDGEISNQEYEFTFLATVPALGMETYFLKEMAGDEGANPDLDVAKIRIMNSKNQPYKVAPFKSIEMIKPSTFDLANAFVKAGFNSEGLLETLTTLDNGVTNRARITFATYGTKASRGEKSGAYLFLPDGEGRTMNLKQPTVRIVQGNIMSYVEVVTSWNKHKVLLLNSPGVDGTGLHIHNDIDLTSPQMDNNEISMRIDTDLKSGDYFYTDLNGFQMIRRKRYAKLPLQGNWYPVPTMAYIQDSSSRLSLISSSPLGGTSSKSGQLEIMLDRRLAQDDNRGLFQGVQDNKVTQHKFSLLLERQVGGCVQEPEGQASYPSLLAHAARHSLLHPYFRLIYRPTDYRGNALKLSYSPVQKPLDCDIHLINLRTSSLNSYSPSPGDKTALILHRQGFNSCYKPAGMECKTTGGKVNLDELFPSLYSSSVNQMSLSLMHEGMKMEKAFTVSIQPMEMYSFTLTR